MPRRAPDPGGGTLLPDVRSGDRVRVRRDDAARPELAGSSAGTRGSRRRALVVAVGGVTALGLAGVPNVGKPTSEHRLLAALAQALGQPLPPEGDPASA